MSLDSLVRIGRLKPHPPNQSEIDDLLAAARRNLQDAGIGAISVENRFDAAYKCLMQSALAALLAKGYRPDTNSPGHHQTVVQTLPKTIGLDPARLPVLDTLRNKRNLSDYTGSPVDPASLRSCIAEAQRLVDEVEAWIRAHPLS